MPVHSDLSDMLRYLQAQISEKDSAIRLTHHPTRNNISLAWGVRNTVIIECRLKCSQRDNK